MKFANVFRAASRAFIASKSRIHFRTVATAGISVLAITSSVALTAGAPAAVDYQAVANDIANLLEADFDGLY